MINTFKANMDVLDQMIAFIRKSAQLIGLEDKVINKIDLACEEVLVNVIQYANPTDGNVTIEVTEPESTTEEKNIKVVISDKGMEFDPIAKPDPDISLPLEERDIGGLGIFLVKNVMDEVTYTREDGVNFLTMIKRTGSTK